MNSPKHKSQAKMKQKGKKTFKKGNQCVQNPATRKFRNATKGNVITKGRYAPGVSGLTVNALGKHNEQMEDEETFSEFGGLAISEITGVTSKSKAFSISGLTDCSNITFHKVLDKWNSPLQSDKEKCAVLAAVTEVIRMKGGSETESEYFAALMTTLERSADEELEARNAITYLLSLVMKKVPVALLRTKFSECSKCFLEILEKTNEDGKTSMLISLLECFSTLMSAQEQAVWTESSTLRSYQIILAFTVHAKPRVRKAAQVAVRSLLKINLLNHRSHPVGPTTAKFCVKQLEQHNDENMSTSHHILNLLKSCLAYFGPDYLKQICETILRLMTLNNVILKTNCLQTLHALFTAHPSEDNLTPELNGKLIAAIYDFQPSVSDVNVAVAWLAVMEAGHANLCLISTNTDGGLPILPKFYGTMMTYLVSDHAEVVESALATMKSACTKCLEPAMEMLVSELTEKAAESTFQQIFRVLETGLKYKYQPAWDKVLQILNHFFSVFGKTCGSAMIKCAINLIDLHDSHQFPFMNDLQKAVGAAFKTIGPKPILDVAPLDLIRTDGKCEFPRAWLLPLMKDSIQETELQYFISELLPVAAKLRQKALQCKEASENLEFKVYQTLQSQIWALLPGFCTNPTDLPMSFKNIAKILGTALMDQQDLRPVVLQALRILTTKTLDANDSKVIGQFAKNYLPILFNLYTSGNEDCQGILLSILETIKSFLTVTEEKLIAVFIGKVFEKLSTESKAENRHNLMDIAIAMVKYSGDEDALKFYQLSMAHLESDDKSMQKKSYRILEEICASNSSSCKKIIDDSMEDLKSKLSSSLSQAAPSSKAPRLRCLGMLMKKFDAEHKDFIVSILPEVILCTKEVGVKAKTAAFDLLIDIGSVLVFISPLSKEDCIGEYFKLVMAGLAGSPHMISATLLSFTKLVFEYRDCLVPNLVSILLSSTIDLLKAKVSEVIKSALLFIRALVKILDAADLSDHLALMVKNLFAWNSARKNAYRQQVRVILERLHKKFGYDRLRSVVPQDHKNLIVHIHKTLERARKQKEAKWQARLAGDTQEEEEVSKVETWEDILADSEMDDTTEKQDKRKDFKKGSTWIVEGGEAVDLLDPKMAKNVVGSKPKRKPISKQSATFEFSNDGKLIIDDEDDVTEKKESTGLDVGEKDILGGHINTPKQIKLGKRKLNEEMPEDGEGRSVYQPGGGGIHRKLDDSEDLKTKKQKQYGEEYKAKKARGDIKLKGKPDPYAYVPLDRQKLNKRKKAKLTGQYAGLVKATKRGVMKANRMKAKHRK